MKKQTAFLALIALIFFLSPGALYARWMNPNNGRFQTMDSYEGNEENPSSLHKYVYAENDPVDKVDLSSNAAYYIERRFSGAKGVLWALELGHGYLLFTDESDPGIGSPFITHQRVIDTFSWHPNVWAYNGSKTPGRIWENHPFDRNPGSCRASVLLTTDPGAQALLLKCINNWKVNTGCGYELGKPKDDPANRGNDIGEDDHKHAPQNGVYYSLRGQNCVWWATSMVMQSGIRLNNAAAFNNAVQFFNSGGGGGYAGEIISGKRSAFLAERMTGRPFGFSLAFPDYDLSGFGVGF